VLANPVGGRKARRLAPPAWSQSRALRTPAGARAAPAGVGVQVALVTDRAALGLAGALVAPACTSGSRAGSARLLSRGAKRPSVCFSCYENACSQCGPKLQSSGVAWSRPNPATARAARGAPTPALAGVLAVPAMVEAAPASPSSTVPREGGFVVVLGAIGIAILLLLFAGSANLVLDEYAKGALRTAVDEAAQAGATAGGSVAACETEAARVRASLVRGPFSAGVNITCEAEGPLMVAVARGDFPSLVPPVPRLYVSVTGVSVIEGAPAQ
jgi:hypothetical protein